MSLRVPLDVFRAGSAVPAGGRGPRLCADELPRPSGRPGARPARRPAHSILYQSGRARSSGWTEFWRQAWPAGVRAAGRPILLAAAIFWIGAVAGFFLTARNPSLERFFVSPAMREAIAAKRALDRVAHEDRGELRQPHRGEQHQRLAPGVGAGPHLRRRHHLARPVQRGDARRDRRGLPPRGDARSAGRVRDRPRIAGAARHLDRPPGPGSSWPTPCSSPAATAGARNSG